MTHETRAKIAATFSDVLVWLKAHPRVVHAAGWLVLGFVLGFVLGKIL